ncbi:MAG: c-type cytochrome biogenesis protein CcmI [Paracoccaceae bacterium]
MTFWIITGTITLAVLTLIALSLYRGRADVETVAAYDLQIYRDQLSEVDRDVARGVLSEADANRVRTEVSRRILAADAALKNAESRVTKGGPAGIVLVFLIVAGVGSFALYNQIGAPGYGDLGLAQRMEAAATFRSGRPDQATAEANMEGSRPGVQVTAEYVELVGQLRVTVAERPNDVEGHRLLARAEARLGNFAAAHEAQNRLLQLLGPDVPVVALMDYADMLILSAGGYVSPEAEQVLEVVLSRDPSSGPGRYYYALMMRQTGRPDIAFRMWDRLLREGPEDADWIPPILEQIQEAAQLAGVNYQLPAIGQIRGPTQADIDATEDMSPSERMQMIEGMIGTLSNRLATEGGPPEDWAQLITSLGVLGRMDQASAVFVNAQEVFADAPTAMDLINRAADRAGLQ